MKVMAILPAAALAAPTPATSDLRRDVEAVHATGAVGVLGEVITPSGRQRARAGAGDLAKYFRALLGGELLAPAQLAEMKKTVPAKGWEAFHPGARYGLGLVWRPLGCGGGYWSHSGTNLGYRNWDGVTADAPWRCRPPSPARPRRSRPT